jgi:hypothetical protein
LGAREREGGCNGEVTLEMGAEASEEEGESEEPRMDCGRKTQYRHTQTHTCKQTIVS